MRVFATLALSVGCLLATTSQAHSPTAISTRHPAVVVVASSPVNELFTGPTFTVSSRPTVSSRSSFGSTPSCRAYSATPSRTFTYSARPAVSTSTASSRPVASPARPAPSPTYTVSSPHPVTPVVHHNHDAGSSSGGMSLANYLVLRQALSSDAPPPTSSYQPQTSYQLQARDDGWSGATIASVAVLGVVVMIGAVVLIRQAT